MLACIICKRQCLTQQQHTWPCGKHKNKMEGGTNRGTSEMKRKKCRLGQGEGANGHELLKNMLRNSGGEEMRENAGGEQELREY